MPYTSSPSIRSLHCIYFLSIIHFFLIFFLDLFFAKREKKKQKKERIKPQMVVAYQHHIFDPIVFCNHFGKYKGFSLFAQSKLSG
jgi:hypothetical protein